jgi:hypothetical protein
VKFRLLSPGRARSDRVAPTQDIGGGGGRNRTLLMVEETGVPGGNHRYVIRADWLV